MRYRLDDDCWLSQDALPASIEVDFERLWRLRPDSFGEVNYGGRIVKTPRWQQSYMRDYWYSGMLHKALPLPDDFTAFLEWANNLGYEKFDQVLINWYENGHHYIGKHSDAERQILEDSPIVSVSLGAERTFRIRRKDSEEIVLDLPMPGGSYVVMGGKMQKRYTHEVPKIAGKKGESVGRRINLTFRKFD